MKNLVDNTKEALEKGGRRTYKKAFKKYKSSIKSLMWKSYDSAAIRYKELVRDLDFSNKSVLDVGCGFGDIIPFIIGKSSSFQYLGIDKMEEFILESKQRYPDYKFRQGNYFKNPLKKKFDIIICCGALNGNYGKNALKIRKKAIKTMFSHCKKAVAFNMAGGILPNNKKDTVLYYVNSRDLLEYCIKLSKKIILRNHYHEKDFTIVIFK